MHNVLKPPMLKPKPSIVGWVYPCIESKKWNRNKTFIVVVYIKTIVKKKTVSVHSQNAGIVLTISPQLNSRRPA